jgi:hypothetical protein
MRLEGSYDFEHRRVQRWVPIVAIVIPVFLFVTGTTWFIRAFIAPPLATIPAPVAVATAPNPAPRAPSPQPAKAESRAAVAYAGTPEPPFTAPLPMFATFALAPPRASLLTAPPATVEPEPNPGPAGEQLEERASTPGPNPEPSPEIVASLPQGAAAGSETAVAAEASQPLAGPIPLPLPKRRISALSSDSQVPLPRSSPQSEATPADPDAERRAFSAHGAE